MNKEEKNDYLLKGLKYMQVPKKFWNSKVSEIRDGKIRNTVEKYIEKFATVYQKGFGLILQGEQGSGKTCVAVVLAKKAHSERLDSQFFDCWNLMERIKRQEEWGDEIGYVERCERADFLILDDLGKEYFTDSLFSEMTINGILRYRAAHMKPTIVTTNLSMEQIEKRYGVSITNRWLECMKLVIFSGDYREEVQDEINKIL